MPAVPLFASPFPLVLGSSAFAHPQGLVPLVVIHYHYRNTRQHGSFRVCSACSLAACPMCVERTATPWRQSASGTVCAKGTGECKSCASEQVSEIACKVCERGCVGEGRRVRHTETGREKRDSDMGNRHVAGVGAGRGRKRGIRGVTGGGGTAARDAGAARQPLLPPTKPVGSSCRAPCPQEDGWSSRKWSRWLQLHWQSRELRVQEAHGRPQQGARSNRGTAGGPCH